MAQGSSNPTSTVINAGTFAVQVDGSALTALQLIDDTVVAQSTALGSTKNSLIGASVTTSPPTYTTGNINPLSQSVEGAQRTTLIPSAAAGLGGLLMGRNYSSGYVSAGGATSNIKASPAQLYGWTLYNTGASALFVRFYNTAGNATVGTTTVAMTTVIPAGGGSNITFPYPVSFSTGLAMAASTGALDTDTATVAANVLVGTVFYI